MLAPLTLAAILQFRVPSLCVMTLVACALANVSLGPWRRLPKTLTSWGVLVLTRVLIWVMSFGDRDEGVGDVLVIGADGAVVRVKVVVRLVIDNRTCRSDTGCSSWGGGCRGS